jgi:hypothetical protein
MAQAAQRHTVWPRWEIPSGLRPPPPKRPSKPVSRDIVADPIPDTTPAIAEVPTASAGSKSQTVAFRNSDEPVLLGGVTATLDISFWRTRWLWRLVASFVVRRLGR